MNRSHTTRLAILAAALALGGGPVVAQMTNAGPASALPEGLGGGGCFTNLQGLGICEPLQICGGQQECDASTPCPDGTVCTVGTACKSVLPGLCFNAYPDGGCSNPGIFTLGFVSCDPVIFHEDFGIIKVGPEGGPGGLDKLAVSNICGSGGTLFKETACDLHDFASSPLEAARWGETPSVCSSYASASHRVVASTGLVDVSKCARSRLDFDYALSLQENGQYDRAFVTLVSGNFTGPELITLYEPVLATNQNNASAQAFTTAALSCAGAVLPVGKLIRDGAWHHFHAELGEDPQVQVKFYVETYDGMFNDGQGFFFDDVRIDCTDLIFDEGFEGGNFLPWSFTTAPPLLVGVGHLVPQPGTCGTYKDCGGPGSGCLNIETAEGAVICIDHPDCELETPCKGSGECAAGEVCAVNTCCGDVCIPASCTPELIIF